MQTNNPRVTSTTAPPRPPVIVPHSISDLRHLFPSTPEGDAQWLAVCNFMARVERTGPVEQDVVYEFYEAIGAANLVQNYIRLDMRAMTAETKAERLATENLHKGILAAAASIKTDQDKALADAKADRLALIIIGRSPIEQRN